MILETQNLTTGYKNGRKPNPITENINVALNSGELVALIGPNGAGKSTLLRTLAGMLPPLSGKVLLDGMDVHKIDPQSLAKRLSVVLTSAPDAGLLTGYALVALGRYPYTGWSGALTSHDEIIVREAVQQVGAEDYAHRPVSEMSDGQRQKIMIARALAQEPRVMILDEPTAYLDLPRRVEILHLLKELTRKTNRAILLSIHDLDLALRTVDRVWLMPEHAPTGKSLITGTPEDLVLNGAFEAAFQKEGVTFDAMAGSFHIPRSPAGDVHLSGDGLANLWTERALNRAGWRVVEHGNASICIEVNDYPSLQWRLMTDRSDQPQTFESIEAVLHALEMTASTTG